MAASGGPDRAGERNPGPEQRDGFARRVGAFLDRQSWDRIDLPLISRCVRSTRLPG